MHPARPEPSASDYLKQPDVRTTVSLTDAHTRRVAARWQYPRHDHPYFEICLLLSGEQQVRLTGRTLEQHAGDLLLITPFEAHSSSTPVASRLYCVHFDLDDLELRRLLCGAGTRVFAADSALTNSLRPALQRLLALAEGRVAGSALARRLETAAALMSLFAALTQGLERDEIAAAPVPQLALQTAGRLAELIEREVQRGGAETSLEAAIRRLGYTPDHGNALFRQVYGMSARQYRSTLKLRRAKLLLMDAQLGIAEVGERLGYASGAHFSRQFKRWCGVAPADYRRSTATTTPAAAASDAPGPRPSPPAASPSHTRRATARSTARSR
jgi:AraC-like DNA-binding protein